LISRPFDCEAVRGLPGNATGIDRQRLPGRAIGSVREARRRSEISRMPLRIDDAPMHRYGAHAPLQYDGRRPMPDKVRRKGHPHRDRAKNQWHSACLMVGDGGVHRIRHSSDKESGM
jgi:hypothetical protein